MGGRSGEKKTECGSIEIEKVGVVSENGILAPRKYVADFSKLRLMISSARLVEKSVCRLFRWINLICSWIEV